MDINEYKRVWKVMSKGNIRIGEFDYFELAKKCSEKAAMENPGYEYTIWVSVQTTSLNTKPTLNVYTHG